MAVTVHEVRDKVARLERFSSSMKEEELSRELLLCRNALQSLSQNLPKEQEREVAALKERVAVLKDRIVIAEVTGTQPSFWELGDRFAVSAIFGALGQFLFSSPPPPQERRVPLPSSGSNAMGPARVMHANLPSAAAVVVKPIPLAPITASPKPGEVTIEPLGPWMPIKEPGPDQRGAVPNLPTPTAAPLPQQAVVLPCAQKSSAVEAAEQNYLEKQRQYDQTHQKYSKQFDDFVREQGNNFGNRNYGSMIADGLPQAVDLIRNKIAEDAAARARNDAELLYWRERIQANENQAFSSPNQAQDVTAYDRDHG